MSNFKNFFKTIHAIFFKQDRFFAQISLGKDLDFLIYERPGVWCSKEELDWLVNSLREVALSGQNGKDLPEYGVLKGEKSDLDKRVISIAIDKNTKKAIGFSAQAYLDLEMGERYETVMHLGLIFIDPNQQGKNLSYLLSSLPNLLIFLKSGLRPIWISSVSQVPAVVGLVAQNYYNVFPNFNKNVKQSFDHKILGIEIMKKYRSVFGVGEDAGYDIDNQIITNAYTGGSDHLKKSFFEAPKHRLSSVNELCQTQLNYERGDDFLQIGKLSLKAFSTLISSKFARSMTSQLFINLLFIAVAGILSPIMGWLIPQKSRGFCVK